jgi:hypothetical protein
VKLILNFTLPHTITYTNSLNRNILTFKANRTNIKVALFNITADPEERHDLSTKLPDVVAKLQERVDFYMKGVVTPRNKPADPKAKETAKRNGAWGPWVREKDLSSDGHVTYSTSWLTAGFLMTVFSLSL